MIVGIPKELSHDEQRVAATPNTTKRLIKQGFEVLVEKGAGARSGFSDAAYGEAGAKVVDSTKELYLLMRLI
jgi:NAD/NADP transhydrogenase alpha subunit